MTIAILPLRALHDGKRRLQAVLSPGERTALVQGMLLRVVQALGDSGCIERIVVVSPDAELLAWVEQFGVCPVQQPDPGLNVGLEHARGVVRAQSPHAAMLIALPDLPLIRPSDVGGIVTASSPDTVVIASDRHAQGTNALRLPPDAGLPFSFGANSRRRHIAAARQCGLNVQEYNAVGTAFDLDTAEDWELVRLPAGRQ